MAPEDLDGPLAEDDGFDEPIEGQINTYHPYWCAFCGERNEVFVDGSGARRQQFTEDCNVCCRPNLLTITLDYSGSVFLEVEQEYEA